MVQKPQIDYVKKKVSDNHYSTEKKPLELDNFYSNHKYIKNRY